MPQQPASTPQGSQLNQHLTHNLMLEMIAAVNASSEAHKEDLKQLHMEFNGLIELNCQVLYSKLGSSGAQASLQCPGPLDDTSNPHWKTDIMANPGTPSSGGYLHICQGLQEESRGEQMSEYIELCLFLHLHYVKDVYANLKKSQEHTQNKGSQGVSSDKLDMGLEDRNERKKLKAQANKLYNFESGKIENVVPLPAGATSSGMQVDNGNDISTKLEGDNDTEDCQLPLSFSSSSHKTGLDEKSKAWMMGPEMLQSA
ncbi:hypothetical protein EDC04DRAFT_2611058 [Pisolithus marmoratus]|nr:hypothetical protein EDC04DRAFT_2611058 [Pisolithus marmoratus]